MVNTLHSAPCSVTQVPVELCSLSTPGSYLDIENTFIKFQRICICKSAMYLIRQPRPPAHSPASLA